MTQCRHREPPAGSETRRHAGCNLPGSMHDAAAPLPPSEPTPNLLYRWFVQYNPLYLVSAALVLNGVIALSESMSGTGLLGQLGITAIAEVYAWALIGSAALLVRIGLRRPAVMLMLIAALYQCDLTLHCATCPWLDGPGLLASLAWLVSFGAKLRALAWALQFRMSRSAMGVAMAGAVGVAGLPWLVQAAPTALAGDILVAWTFGLFAAGLWTHRRVDSKVVLDEWGRTVAHRCFRAIWGGWAIMALLHVAFLAAHLRTPLLIAPWLFAVVLLATRTIRSESRAWAVTLATVVYAGVVSPQHLAITAAMAGTVLALRALRQPTLRIPDSSVPAPVDPYRIEAVPTVPPMPELRFAPALRPELLRLLSGAAGLAYVAIWTHGWSGGSLPAHVVPLDLALLAVGAVVAWSTRTTVPLAPGLLTCAHWVVSARVIPMPRSHTHQAIAHVVAGFVLLAVSLGASLWWARRKTRVTSS